MVGFGCRSTRRQSPRHRPVTGSDTVVPAQDIQSVLLQTIVLIQSLLDRMRLTVCVNAVPSLPVISPSFVSTDGAAAAHITI
jgi:hypothetical protein